MLTLIDLTEYNDTRKLCLRIVGNGGVEQEDAYRYQPEDRDQVLQHKHTHVSTSLGGHISVGFFNQHVCLDCEIARNVKE